MEATMSMSIPVGQDRQRFQAIRHLEVGQWTDYPRQIESAVRTSVRYVSIRYEKKFVTSMKGLNGVIRVWRLA